MSYTALSAISSHPTRCTDDTELTGVISQLQDLRKTLHEQFIVEEASLHRHPQRNKQLLTASTLASATEKDKFSGVLPNAPPASELHRTLDNPTLSLLKSVNYPFSLCEEAPPSYTPPSVPFDVESEVEQLKRSVLQVQAELQEYLSNLTYTTANDDNKGNNIQKYQTTDPTKATSTTDSSNSIANMLGSNKDDKESSKCKITQSDVLNFFSSNAHFAELAWNVSSLQWFYRWVLSHSISLLWNAKEQLEYVLTESGQALPSSVEEMDRCLASYPFSAAVAILDNDRQMVIAEERRKLNTTVSRTYKDRLPVDAVKIATSCYLSAEEKYMYQEFYNQSEHLLLLLRHSQLLEVNEQNNTILSVHNKASRHKSTSNANGNSGDKETNKVKEGTYTVRDSWNSNKGSESTLNNTNEKNEKDSVGGHRHSDASNSSSPSKENISIAYIIAEVKAALKAEKEMIMMLLDTIAQRRRDNVFYDISEEEYARSRQAAIAVYGCVASDISLMAFQMTVAAEFLCKYEEWLRYHGFASHDALMSELCKHNLNAEWPLLDAYTCHAGHANHFVPPTSAIAQMEWMRLNSNVIPEANLLVRDNASNDKEEYQASTSTLQREMEEKDKQIKQAKVENRVCPQHSPKQPKQQQKQQHPNHPFLLSPLPLSSTSEISSFQSIKDNKETTLPDKKLADNDNTKCNSETLMTPFTHSSVENPEAQSLIYNKQKEENEHHHQQQEEEEQKEIDRANNSNTHLPFTIQESTERKNDKLSCQDALNANDVWIENEYIRCTGGNYHQVESILHAFVHILCEVVERYTDMCIADKTLRFENFSLWEVWLALCVEYTFIWCITLEREVDDDENKSTYKRRTLPSTNTIKTHGITDKNLEHIKEKVECEKKDIISKNIETRLHREAQIVRQKLLDEVKECVKTLEGKILRLHSLTMKCIDYNDNKESTVEHFVQDVTRFIDEVSNLYDANPHVAKNVFHSSLFPSSGCDNKNADNAINTHCDNCVNKNKISTKLACAFSINVTLNTITSADLQTCQNVDYKDHKLNSVAGFNKQCVVAFVQKALTLHNVAMWLRVHEMVKHNAELFAINKRLTRSVDNYLGDDDYDDGDHIEQANHLLQEKRFADSIDDSINVNRNDNGSGLCTNYTNRELSSLRSNFYFLPAHINFLSIARIRGEDSEEGITGIVIEFDIPEIKKINKKFDANNELQNQQIEQHQQQQLHSQSKESDNSAISLHTLLEENGHVKRGDKIECKGENNKVITNVRYALARWLICSYNQLYKNNLLGLMRCDEQLLNLISLSDYIFLQRAQVNFLQNCCHSKENCIIDLKEVQILLRTQKFNELCSIEYTATMYIASPYALDFIRWQRSCAAKIENANVNANDALNFAISTNKLYNPEQETKELWSVYYQLAEILCVIASINSLSVLELSSKRLVNVNKSDDTTELHLHTLQLLAEQLKDDALVLQEWHHHQEHYHCEEETLTNIKELHDKVYKIESNNTNDTKQKELIAKISKLNVLDVKQTEYAVKRLNFSVILEHLDDYIINWITPRQMLATVRESIYTGDAREASL